MNFLMFNTKAELSVFASYVALNLEDQKRTHDAVVAVFTSIFESFSIPVYWALEKRSFIHFLRYLWTSERVHCEVTL